MFGFGRKKILLAAAVTEFFGHIERQVIDNLQSIRQIAETCSCDLSDIGDDQLYSEIFPCALVWGLQPVRNIWDETKFEHARREVVRLIEQSMPSKVSHFVKLRVDEALTAWNDTFESGGNLPWDNLTIHLMTRLGLTRFGGLEITVFSSLLMTMQGKFWKDLDKKLRLA